MENIIQTEVLNAKIRQLEFELKLQKERYQVLKTMTNCGLWEYDIATGTLYQSRKLDGPYEDDNLIMPDYRNKMKSWGLIHLEDMDIFDAYCDSMDRGDAQLKYELRMMADKEEYIWLQYEGATVSDEQGNPIKVIGITRDVTEERQSQEALMQLAQIDQLTGLLNKSATQSEIDTYFGRERKHSTEMNAVYIMDIDDFKGVNDQYGHLYGDYVLKEIAKTLRECFDQDDILGRIGGDEFIIMKKKIKNKKEIEVYAAQLLEAVSALRLSKGNRVTISIGISVYPKDDLTYEALYHKADIALYHAKELGKNTYYVFNPIEKYDQTLTITGRNHGEMIQHTRPDEISFSEDGSKQSSAADLLKINELEKKLQYINEIMNQQDFHYYGVHPATYLVETTGNCSKDTELLLEKDRVCYECLGLDAPCSHCPVAAMQEYEALHQTEFYDEKQDTWVSNTAVRVSSGNGDSVCLIGRQNLNRMMHHVQPYDSLTGLMPLERFQRDAMRQQTVEETSRGRAMAAICMKNYEKLHEEFGFAVGVNIIKTTGEMIASCLAEGEFGCRHKRDEFLLYLYYDDASKLRERLINTLRSAGVAVEETFANAHAYYVCGVYHLKDREETVAEGIDRAVMARNRLLRGGHGMANEMTFFDENMEDDFKLKCEIQNTMLDALLKHEFKIYFQPKVTVDEIQIKGAEVLSRWMKEDGRQISPAQYIPVFEETGFLLELDLYTYTEVFKQVRKWLDEEVKLPVISLNLSKLHIHDEAFIDKFINLAKRYEIPSGMIELEFPEELFIGNLDQVLGVIETLRSEGFLISIDNFGLGYSSLNLIKILPIDVLKLDKNFFKQKILRETDKKTISDILHLAKKLGFKTVCEGVETREQVEFIDSCGNDMVQGYYYYKPMPIEEFEELIRK